jgi:hypothetical protein
MATGLMNVRGYSYAGHVSTKVTPPPQRLCPSTKPLTPGSHIGDVEHPTDKPDSINIYLHDNYALSNEIDRLSEDYVLDAHYLKLEFTP